MLKIKKIAAIMLCALIITALSPITASAYDYNDYLKDAKEVADVYTDCERVFEIAEVITQTYPDYWEAKDPVQVLYDATGMLADENDAFYQDFFDAILSIQTEYGLDDSSQYSNGRTNLENLEAQFRYTEKVTNNQELFKSAMNRLLTEKPEYTDILIAKMFAFTDQYSRYIKGVDYYSVQSSQANSQIGIGVYAAELGEGFIVTQVINGSGADAAGIAVGDIITKIDGETYTFTNQVSARGAENTTVDLTVLHEDGTEEIITVKRVKYSEGGMKFERIDDTVIIGFKSFDLMSDAEDFEKYYDAAAADPTVKKLVIDLRDNGGGDQQVLETILSVIAPNDKPMFTVVNKDGKETFRTKGRYKGAGKKFTGQLFVLTNGNTASAADILTASVRYLGGIQVGETTYGKGIGQSGFILHNGYMAWVTSMFVDVPFGGRYHGKGFVPNKIISEYVPLYSADEIIKLSDTNTPITETTDKNRIKAFEQELQAVTGFRLNADGVLDKRTALLTNALLFHSGLPLLDFEDGYVIDPATIKLIHQAATKTGMTNFKTKSEIDLGLQYCLKYKVKAAKAAA